MKSAYADDRGADIGAHLGEVLWQSGRRDEAEKVWAEAGQGRFGQQTAERNAAQAARSAKIATMRRPLAMLVCLAALAGCATVRRAAPPAGAPAPWDERMSQLEHAASWRLDGRAAAALGQQGWQATLDWRQNGTVSDLHLAGPLGIGSTQIRVTPAGLSLNGAPPSGAVVAQLEERARLRAAAGQSALLAARHSRIRHAFRSDAQCAGSRAQALAGGVDHRLRRIHALERRRAAETAGAEPLGCAGAHRRGPMAGAVRDREPAPWPAPAKLNLFLHIVGRRPDGYHELQTCSSSSICAMTSASTVRADGEIRARGWSAGRARRKTICACAPPGRSRRRRACRRWARTSAW